MNTVFKVIFIVIILISLILIGKFANDKYFKDDQKLVSISPGVLPHNPAISDEKAVEVLAENFVSSYGSYQKGTFNSLNEAKKLMTKKYQEETARFIEEKKYEQNNAPFKEYIIYVSVPEQTTIVALDERDAEVSVNFEQNIFYGAHIYLNGILTTVDQSGNKTSQILEKESIKKQATILIYKEDGLWKVDSIKIK